MKPIVPSFARGIERTLREEVRRGEEEEKESKGSTMEKMCPMCPMCPIEN
jgi:hypothetical protein